jgi:hypothetical protein
MAPAALADTTADALLRAQLDSINNSELRTNAQEVITAIRAARPKNTHQAYKPKQREFKKWCQEKQFHDSDTVTEDKLLLFIVNEVANRPLRARSHNINIDKSIPRNQTKLTWRSVRSYVSAITDLYREQKAMGINCHASPREDTVGQYLKTLQRRDAQRQKEQFADKGRDTLLDGYSEEEFEHICRELWDHSESSPECHFRTLLDLLLGHYLLARGGDRRAAEISDLFTFEFAGEGPTRCMPVILTTRGGKQNQHGRLETAGALRNMDPQICLLGGLAFYLLYRWDLTDEPFPDLSQRPAWYNIRLLKGSAAGASCTASLAYNSQRDWVSKAFDYAGVVSHKKTHIGRSSGAKPVELKGISEDQIRRAGRWNQEQMVGCYLNSLPRKFMRIMAGHPPQMGCFEIRRASVAPPSELLSLIWPELDRWRDRFGLQNGQINDLAAMGLTSLLFYLREVILQDSVIMRQRFPNSPIWNHAVFQHKAYEQFSAHVQEVVGAGGDGERPTQLALLTQAIPELADSLRSIDARIEASSSELKAAIGGIAKQQQQRDAQGAELLQWLAHSLACLPRPLLLQQQPLSSAPFGAGAAAAATIAGASSSCYTSARASLAPSLAPNLPDGSSIDPLAATTAAAAQQQLLEPPEPPCHRMCRSVKTVEALWREWTVGLNGQLSISALDSRWGSRWRAGRQSELQWYSLRLEVIREIRRVAHAQRSSEQQAMWALQHQQQKMGCSLDRFCKHLRASRTRSARTADTGASRGRGKGKGKQRAL